MNLSNRIPRFFRQARIIAYDTANTGQKATATVTITVIRNPNAPRFTQSNYDVTINDRYVLGQQVFDLRATDADNVSIVFAGCRNN